MNKMKDSWWNAEEYEDLVARALIAAYETHLYQEKPAKIKGFTWVTDPWRAATLADLKLMRKLGPHFVPDDRYFLGTNDYWWQIDGLPEVAAFSFKQDAESLSQMESDFVGQNSYLDVFTAKRVRKLPTGCLFLPGKYVAKYRVTLFYPKNDGIEGYAYYIGVKESGRIVLEHAMQPEKNNMAGSVTLQGFADMKYLWNVRASEGGGRAKATFGVYKEQIKSLFYARKTPLTVTGRKRPILHWVAAHRRRIKAGTDVDIEKHLRGITEFEMNGTRFQITRPVKASRRK